MTRLENKVGTRALYEIGRVFVKEFVRSFDKAPKRIIPDVDDTNANTYGTYSSEENREAEKTRGK